jgi:hypothetical protein
MGNKQIFFRKNLETLNLRSSSNAIHFSVRPFQDIGITDLLSLRMGSQISQQLKHCESHQLPQ